MADEILYQGPKRGYEPTDGANRDKLPLAADLTEPTGFADLDYLRRLLSLIRRETAVEIVLMEEELNQLVLHIKTDSSDDKLREAMGQEWPATLGRVQSFIPYQYYKALQFRDTASATYIRDRWKSAAREVGGSRTFDLILPLYMIRSEVQFIEDFLVQFIGDVNDSSEERIVELFQEWAAVALTAVRKISKEYKTPDSSRKLTEQELKEVKAAEAAQYQAIFAVKVNALNTLVDQQVSLLTKNWSSTSDYFYNRLLGPALQFRLKTSRKVYPGNGRLASIATQAAESLNGNLSLLITDQMRRNEIFVAKIDSFNDAVSLRDTYRTYVVQLAAVSEKPVTATIQKSEFVLNPDEWFDAVVENATPTTYGAYHEKLLGLDEVDAHPQYLDRLGRNVLQGNVKVAPGVRVDGVDLDRHAHTGDDGSARIKGEDIDGLVANVIDRDVEVDAPYNVRLVKSQASASGRGLDVHIAWDGLPEHLYDIQVVPVSGSVDQGFSMVFDGFGVGLGTIIALNTWSGDNFNVLVMESEDLGRGGITCWSISATQEPTLLFSVADLAAFLGIDVEYVSRSMIYLVRDMDVDENGNMYMPQPWGYSAANSDGPGSGIIKFNKATRTFERLLVEGGDGVDTPYRIVNTISVDRRRNRLVCAGFDVSFVPLILDPESGSPEVFDLSVFMFTCGFNGENVIDLTPWDTTGDLDDMVIPFGTSDTSADGHTYMTTVRPSTGDLGLAKIHVLTGFVEFIEIPTDELNMEGIMISSIVSLRHETLFFVGGEEGIRYYAMKKDGSVIVDITTQIPVSTAVGLATDKYGRVYVAALFTNKIYRVFGQTGTGIF